jgi:hypothetical protein
MRDCLCSLRERLVGDGCHICNPEFAAELSGPVSIYHPGGLHHLEIQPHGYPFSVLLPVIRTGRREATNSWTWNGSTEKPTLRPSIRTRHPDGTVSHLWLTEGLCQHLADSTDGFAGQTLPLPPIKSSGF